MIQITRVASYSAALLAALLITGGAVAEDDGVTAEDDGAVANNDVITTDTHRLQKVADGVYLAQSTARIFNSHALIIINESDVTVIDSHITPTKARGLIASIKQLTSNPITTLINSHFHYDHSHGNQAFGPDVQIIGHEYTRMKMAGKPLEEGTFMRGKAGNIARLTRLQQELDTTEDAERREEIAAQAKVLAAHVEAWNEIDPVAPSVTLNDRLTLFRGSREIQLHFMGRAHTGGDLVVYLPADKLAFTGDMMLQGPSWLGDGYVDEWVQTLENLKGLDFTLMVPGHGSPFTDRKVIDYVQAYYEDLWDQVAKMHKDGTSVADAAKAVDLTSHTNLRITRVGTDPLAVARIYQRLEGAD